MLPRIFPQSEISMTEDRLVIAIKAFEAALKKSAGINKEEFVDRRKELVELRREIADRRIAVSSIADETLQSGELPQAFRSRFSKVCAAISLHQATWPITLIDHDSAAYRSSIAAVRAEYVDFFRWTRETLG